MTAATVAFINVPCYDGWARVAKLSTDEDTRLKRAAAVLREHNVDIIGANELVTYQNAEVLSKAMGWGGRLGMTKVDGKYNGKIDLDLPEASGFLKGSGHPGVAMGWIWDPNVLAPYWGKEMDTYPGWSRNRWSLALRAKLLQQDNHRLGMQLFHLEFEPRGDNTKGKFYNGIRYKQIDFGLDASMSPNQSWFVGGDWNHAANDAPDSPGNAGRKHGLVNCATNNIIRAQKTKDIKTGKAHIVQLGRGVADHPALIVPGLVVPR